MKSVLITGASRGIGRALCAEALARGYKVHAFVRTKGTAAPGCVEHLGDIRDRAAIERTITGLAPELTHVIANAGVEGNYNPRDPKAPEKAMDVIEINATATAYTMLVAAREWVRLGLRDRSIAVTSSLAAGRGMPGASLYIATKSFELVLGQSLDADLRPFGIAVSVIRPGFIRTDLTADNSFPMPFLMDADRAARIIWNGIERGKFEIAFPFVMWLVSWVRDNIPMPVFRLLNRGLGRAAEREGARRGPAKKES